MHPKVKFGELRVCIHTHQLIYIKESLQTFSRSTNFKFQLNKGQNYLIYEITSLQN